MDTATDLLHYTYIPADFSKNGNHRDDMLVAQNIFEALCLVRIIHDNPEGHRLLIADLEAFFTQARTWWSQHRDIGMPAFCPLPQWMLDLVALHPKVVTEDAPLTPSAPPKRLHIAQVSVQTTATIHSAVLWTQITTATLKEPQ